MRKRPSIRKALAIENPLVTPAAHDALAASMIERAGFLAMAIGGSAMLAARYALPDLGIAALGEMEAGIRDILSANRLPCIVDGDDGYGDTKSVVRMMNVYEDLGASGVFLEDQLRAGKQPGDSAALGLASVSEMVEKLRAALGAREDPDFLVIARSDAYGPEGLDGAMARAESYLAAGADGAFLPGLGSPEELARVGAAFRGTHLVVVMVEGSPAWLSPGELGEMGFKQVVYPAHLMARLVESLDQGLRELRAYGDGKAELPIQPGAAEAKAALRESLRESFWKETAAKVDS